MGMVGVAVMALGWGCASPSNGVKTGMEPSTPRGAGGQGGAAVADAGQDAPAASGGGGAGGKALGSTGSFGGFAGGDEPSCSELVTQYANTVVGAQACDVDGTGQCQQLVAATLSTCPACMTYVNDAASANMIRSDWMQFGCAAAASGQPCPQLTCPQPTGGHCAATSSGGTCSAN